MSVKKFFKHIFTVLLIVSCMLTSSVVNAEENLEQKIQTLSEDIKNNPNNAELYKERGQVYGNLQKYEQAIQDFNKAIKLNPNYAEAYNNRDIAYALLENLKQAIEDFSKAIELEPTSQRYQNRGTCYQELGDEVKSQADFQKANQLNQKN